MSPPPSWLSGCQSVEAQHAVKTEYRSQVDPSDHKIRGGCKIPIATHKSRQCAHAQGEIGSNVTAADISFRAGKSQVLEASSSE
jgi:hypothetical protein